MATNNDQTPCLSIADARRAFALASQNGGDFEKALAQVLQEKAGGQPADVAQSEQEAEKAQEYMRDHPGTDWRSAVRYARTEQPNRYGRKPTAGEKAHLLLQR